MKILLLGEYSNVHNTLAMGLRRLGHEVTVASNGDFWKAYPRDIDLARKPGKIGGLKLMANILGHLPRFKGHDVVQIINPMFVELKAERIAPLYRWLRRHNTKMVMGAMGMDYYWVNENITTMPLRYSDFNLGDTLRTTPEALSERADWIDTPKGRLNQDIAADCDGIVCGLYEYWACYHPLFNDKTSFIPFPIVPKQNVTIEEHKAGRPVRIFVGISKGRHVYKGTDIMLAAAQDVAHRHPGRLQIDVANGVPFAQYVEMMGQADAILDQLYSYTPAMNALEAMSRGIICVGGGEPENYDILGEHELRPIVNVEPNYESVYRAIENLVLHPEQLAHRKRQGLEYIRRHHDYIKVASQYVSFYQSHGKNSEI